MSKVTMEEQKLFNETFDVLIKNDHVTDYGAYVETEFTDGVFNENNALDWFESDLEQAVTSYAVAFKGEDSPIWSYVPFEDLQSQIVKAIGIAREEQDQ